MGVDRLDDPPELGVAGCGETKGSGEGGEGGREGRMLYSHTPNSIENSLLTRDG